MSVTADLMDTSRGTGPITIHDYGDRALLLEFGSTAEVLAWTDAVREAALLGVLDIVPASRTVLIKLAGPRYQAPTRATSRQAPRDGRGAVGGGHSHDGRADIAIDVVYDGATSMRWPRLTGMTTDQVIAAHTGTCGRSDSVVSHRVSAYLVGGIGVAERLNVPRQSEPRTRVPAGSVALAGEFSGVYPRESPGGWQLIGRTEAELWDVDRDPPALLRPGMWVQFREVRS